MRMAQCAHCIPVYRHNAATARCKQLTSTSPSAPVAASVPAAAAALLSSSATRLPSPVRGLAPGLLTPIDDKMRVNNLGVVVALPLLLLSRLSDVFLRPLDDVATAAAAAAAAAALSACSGDAVAGGVAAASAPAAAAAAAAVALTGEGGCDVPGLGVVAPPELLLTGSNGAGATVLLNGRMRPMKFISLVPVTTAVAAAPSDATAGAPLLLLETRAAAAPSAPAASTCGGGSSFGVALTRPASTIMSAAHTRFPAACKLAKRL